MCWWRLSILFLIKCPLFPCQQQQQWLSSKGNPPQTTVDHSRCALEPKKIYGRNPKDLTKKPLNCLFYKLEDIFKRKYRVIIKNTNVFFPNQSKCSLNPVQGLPLENMDDALLSLCKPSHKTTLSRSHSIVAKPGRDDAIEIGIHFWVFV